MAGVENLYSRMERMTSLMPLFIDVTWGASGSTEELSFNLLDYANKFLGTNVLMHISCTGLTRDQIHAVLVKARGIGIKNILALRGDPPKGALTWEPVPGGFKNATELVQFIRDEFHDDFGIAVCGFPEGHPDNRENLDYDNYILTLKQKVDAGADFVLTQFFYDPEVFLHFLTKCREVGITCPIIPSVMPIHTFASFQRMIKHLRISVPDAVWADLAPIRDDDAAVKGYGVKYCVKMIRKLQQSDENIRGFHFFTLNLESSVLGILKELQLHEASARRNLPWRGSRCDLNGMKEDVRPINWCNRPKSYIQRTDTWDEFPNGRWGDGRSPAFGELNAHFFGPSASFSKKEYLAMWGEAPVKPHDVFEVFARYVEGKIPLLPWCETELQAETTSISHDLARINRSGLLTINSQPPVNGVRSDDPVSGWGGSGGYVYQKAYVEFFCSPTDLKLFVELIPRYEHLNFHAINALGESINNGHKSVTALTWGVFPNREILQPTIFDPDSFHVWSKESFQLWKQSWAMLYDDASESADLLYGMHDSYYLVAIIDNNYVESDLYAIFWELIELRKARGGDVSPKSGSFSNFAVATPPRSPSGEAKKKKTVHSPNGSKGHLSSGSLDDAVIKEEDDF